VRNKRTSEISIPDSEYKTLCQKIFYEFTKINWEACITQFLDQNIWYYIVKSTSNVEKNCDGGSVVEKGNINAVSKGDKIVRARPKISKPRLKVWEQKPRFYCPLELTV